MLLIGDANWWLPSRLSRVLPHLRVEGSAAREHHHPGGLGDRGAVPPVPVPEPSAG